MDEEPIQPVKYMTVPEKIELKPDGGGYQDASRERYRPMKVTQATELASIHGLLKLLLCFNFRFQTRLP